MEAREHGQWTMSRLAAKRAAQRNVDPRLFPLLQRYGQKLYIGGDLHVFLGKDMVPEDEFPEGAPKRIQNTMVVVALDGTVKTVWKDSRALRRLRKRRLHGGHRFRRQTKRQRYRLAVAQAF